MTREELARAKTERRNAAVLGAAIELAKKRGLSKITRDEIAQIAGVSTGSVHNAFGGMDSLKDEILRAAVVQAIPEIVAQGLASGSEIAKNAAPDLKRRALATIS